MEPIDSPRRKYQSLRRKEQARETRERILAAALKLFSTNGYAGATVDAIAQEAGVAPLTVFSIFGNKRTILAELVKFSVGGDDKPIPLLERPGPRAVMAEPDPNRQLRLLRPILQTFSNASLQYLRLCAWRQKPNRRSRHC